MKYYFSDFIYDTEQNKLWLNDTLVNMTKKGHELLLFFLQNKQRLIRREEIIESVWNGRVVTSNTIDQTILKLRNTLNSAKSGDYIESVYGQGVRFLVDVDTTPLKEDNQSIRHRANKYWLIVSTAGFMVLIFSWLAWINFYNPTDKVNKPIDVMLKYDENQNIFDKSSWLVYGSSNYLAYLLNQNPDLQILREYKDEQINSGKKLNILEHISKDGKSTRIKIQFDHVKNKEYIAELEALIEGKETIKTTIKSTKIYTLISSINDWVTNKVFNSSTPVYNNGSIFSTDEYALESYFRAMQAQASGDSNQAITFLQTATRQDPNFKYAWYQLAVSYRKQGDSKKAISILNAIETNDPYLLFQITLVGAQCLDILERFEQAGEKYAKAYEMAIALKHLGKQSAVLISQAIFFRKLANYRQSEESLEKALKITNVELQPFLYGTLMSTYAKLDRDQQKYDSAIDKAKKAINAFHKASDSRYEALAKTTLSSILILRNEFHQAKKWISEALFYAEQVESLRGISDNKTKLAMIYQQIGKFQLAIDSWNEVINLTNQLELYGNTTQAYLWLLKIQLHLNDMDNAKISLKMIEQLYTETQRQSVKKQVIEAKILMALKEKDIEVLPSLLIELEVENYWLSVLCRGDYAMTQQKFAAAEIHYQNYFDNYKNSGNYQLLVEVLNKLSALYIETGSEKLIQNINLTQTYNPLIYPFNLYKAQAELLKNNKIEALSLLEETKIRSFDLWTENDEKLLKKIIL